MKKNRTQYTVSCTNCLGPLAPADKILQSRRLGLRHLCAVTANLLSRELRICDKYLPEIVQQRYSIVKEHKTKHFRWCSQCLLVDTQIHRTQNFLQQIGLELQFPL